MFSNILVPTDGTERSRNALDMAVRLLSREGAVSAGEQPGTITLLHVIETIAGDEETEEFRRFYSALEKRARKRMSQLVEEHSEHQHLIRQTVLFGGRVSEILRYAEENSVDLIVLSSHKIDPERPAEGWGTISHKVGILASCPVLLVK
jgi:nucleotide-binding universal stress UspA family protein